MAVSPVGISSRLRVVSITCYGMPDYVRSRSLRAALAANPRVELTVVKNASKGAMRYIEVLRELWRVRCETRPDVYLLNFRGYEMLLPVLLIAGRKPVIFDEMVNPMLVVREHRLIKKELVKWLMGAWPAFGWLYHLLLRRCYAVLTDTPAHGRYSAGLSGMAPDRYKAIPVGADETIFHPVRSVPKAGDGNTGKAFQVFTYSPGSQPLHGLRYFFEAAVLLHDRADITFLISGTKGDIAGRVAEAVKRGARIEHRAWIPFEELPDVISQAGICLGGPFGGTQQAQLVITGKTYQFLACAAPVIIGESPSTADFCDRQNSLVVPQADAAALAASIAWAADHPKELRRIANAGRALYELRYSSKIIAKEVDELLAPLHSAQSPEKF